MNIGNPSEFSIWDRSIKDGMGAMLPYRGQAQLVQGPVKQQVQQPKAGVLDRAKNVQVQKNQVTAQVNAMNNAEAARMVLKDDASIKAFQTAYGLKPDGMVGWRTAAMMNKVLPGSQVKAAVADRVQQPAVSAFDPRAQEVALRDVRVANGVEGQTHNVERPQAFVPISEEEVYNRATELPHQNSSTYGTAQHSTEGTIVLPTQNEKFVVPTAPVKSGFSQNELDHMQRVNEILYGHTYD